jgi:hypothetical protein
MSLFSRFQQAVMVVWRRTLDVENVLVENQRLEIQAEPGPMPPLDLQPSFLSTKAYFVMLVIS